MEKTSAYQQTQADVDQETLLVLGASPTSSGFRVPRATMVTVALLDSIESPFIRGVKEPELMDMFRALYVMASPDDAADKIFSAKRRQACLAGMTVDATDRAAYYKATQDAAACFAEFDCAAAEYGRGCGTFDPMDAIACIRHTLSMSMHGFAMIETREEDSASAGPFAPTMVSGLRQRFQWLRKCLTRRRTT